MKKYVVFSLVIIALLLVWNAIMSIKINMLEQHIYTLESYTKAQIYKKDAQLYLMNATYGNEDMHKALADSCKNDCLKYKNVKYE